MNDEKPTNSFFYIPTPEHEREFRHHLRYDQIDFDIMSQQREDGRWDIFEPEKDFII
jgi:hypothetical protein